jgi:heme-degrading monooxygenase HmoA
MTDQTKLPDPPYYAVIFTSKRTTQDEQGYQETARKMAELAAQQPGYLGIESARTEDGFGITVSYWENLDAIAAWRADMEHRIAQLQGRRRWYEQYESRIAKVESYLRFPL